MIFVLWLSEEAEDDAADLPGRLELKTPAMMAPATNTQPATAKATRFRLLVLLLLPTVPATAVAAAPVAGVGAGVMGAIGGGCLICLLCFYVMVHGCWWGGGISQASMGC